MNEWMKMSSYKIYAAVQFLVVQVSVSFFKGLSNEKQ